MPAKPTFTRSRKYLDMRTLIVLVGMMIGLAGAPALAAETSPTACMKAVNIKRLEAFSRVNWTVVPNIATVETDRLTCSFLMGGVKLVMVYARPDPDRSGEWKTQQALHKGNTERMPVGEGAFLLHEGDTLGLVAYAKKTTYVIIGFPAADEPFAKEVLLDMAQSVIAAY